MEEKKINTGNKDLDRDLKDFLDFFEDQDKLMKIMDIFSDINAKLEKADEIKDEIKDILEKNKLDFPGSLINLSLALGNPDKYQKIIGESKEEGRPYIEKAKSIIDEDLGNLKKFLAFGQENKKIPQKAPGEITDSPLMNIETISHLPEWLGGPEALIPATRIAMRDASMRNLFTAAIDWRTLFFLAAGFAELAKIQLEYGISFVEKGLITEESMDRESMAQHIINAQVALNKIKELAPKFGIDIEKNK